ncbi:1,4-dihydroxy-2-naphthoate polyprenyltransferase [Brevibacterium album]|uniref:1,4-dihydroxy-2-naphthoate polyprenyltransferase n=1 Tax=Brevibacterium album TaxID=417948 RepID=UPI0003F807D4|nr:1,4-dihydroxy-2-naphthoate polyprenyltransferase [Brevibacterium album]
MATFGEWVSGARLRTLPLALAPVLIGTGAGLGALGGFSVIILGSVGPGQSAGLDVGAVLLRSLLALIVALGLQIGSNYANDYSDGIRGTDDERVGPMRLTASGAAAPEAVRRAAFISFGVAAAAGVALVLASRQWWLIPVGVLAVLAAWYYTGGKRPYGYMALGEVFVFVFFGLVATLGTAAAISGAVTLAAVSGAIGIGLFACAVLMANNIRDIPSDREVGKNTLAVVMGDQLSRAVYTLLVALPYVFLMGAILDGHPQAVLAVLSLVVVVQPVKIVLSGASGAALIPTIKSTSLAALAYAFLLGIGTAL